MSLHNYKRLNVWQKAIDLSVIIYKLTAKFPDSEKFGLISQMRRCSISIPSNIAEGSGRDSEKEFNHFLAIANGSANELETQLIISFKLNFISEPEVESISLLINEVQKMIFSLQKKVNK